MNSKRRWFHGQFEKIQKQCIINWSSSSEDDSDKEDSTNIIPKATSSGEVSPIIRRHSKLQPREIEWSETQNTIKYEIETITSQRTSSNGSIKFDAKNTFIDCSESDMSPIIGRATRRKCKKNCSKSILDSAKKYEIHSDSSDDNAGIASDDRDSTYTTLTGVSSVLYLNPKTRKKCKYKSKGYAIKAYKTLRQLKDGVDIWKHEMNLSKNLGDVYKEFTIKKIVGEFLVNFVLAEENVLILLGKIDVTIEYEGEKLLLYPPYTLDETVFDGNKMNLYLNVSKYLIQ